MKMQTAYRLQDYRRQRCMRCHWKQAPRDADVRTGAPQDPADNSLKPKGRLNVDIVFVYRHHSRTKIHA
jgi:hypothetical protein